MLPWGNMFQSLLGTQFEQQREEAAEGEMDMASPEGSRRGSIGMVVYPNMSMPWHT